MESSDQLSALTALPLDDESTVPTVYCKSIISVAVKPAYNGILQNTDISFSVPVTFLFKHVAYV
jgi:hypothetical protein